MSEIVILRVIHILSASIWVGSAVFGTVLLMPTLASLGPGAGPVMAGLRDRGMVVFLPIVALLTILSGLRLMWIVSGGFGADYFVTAWGATYAASGAAAILVFALGIVFSRPQQARMGALTAQLQAATDDATRGALSLQLAAAKRRARSSPGCSWCFWSAAPRVWPRPATSAEPSHRRRDARREARDGPRTAA